MNEHEYNVVDAMRNYGGSFVQALSECFYHADPINLQRLKTAFSDYWKEYEEIAKQYG